MEVMLLFKRKTQRLGIWGVTKPYPGQCPVYVREGKLSHRASWLEHPWVSLEEQKGWQANEFWTCPKAVLISAGLSR